MNKSATNECRKVSRHKWADSRWCLLLVAFVWFYPQFQRHDKTIGHVPTS